MTPRPDLPEKLFHCLAVALLAIGCLFLASPAAAANHLFDEPVLFEGEITPENVEGKIFAFVNLEGRAADSGDEPPMYANKYVDPLGATGGQLFALFHVGTDEDTGRHHFAVAQYWGGYLVDVQGQKPPSASDLQIPPLPFVKNWEADDRVFYFEKASWFEESWHAWHVMTWYSNMAWNGWEESDHMYVDTPYQGTQGHQAWQLHQYGTFDVPEVQPAEKNKVVSDLPRWESPDPPQSGEGTPWQLVGSTAIPYFMVGPPSFGPLLSRYFVLKRWQRWKFVKDSQANGSSKDVGDEFKKTYGWSESVTQSFGETVGVQLGAKGGLNLAKGVVSLEASKTVSDELSWGWAHTGTTTAETSITSTYTVPAHKQLWFWQIEEKLELIVPPGDGTTESPVAVWTLPVDEIAVTEVPVY